MPWRAPMPSSAYDAQMKILELHTGLFPDARTVAAALQRLEGERGVVCVDVSRPDMEEAEWDGVLAAILAADLIITT